MKTKKKNRKTDGFTGYLKPQGVYIALNFIFSLFSVSFMLLTPILTGDLIDLIVGPGNVDFAQIPKYIILTAVSAICFAFFSWCASAVSGVAAANTVKSIRKDAFRRINSATPEYIDRTSHGDIINRVSNDAEFVCDGLLQGITQLFTGILTLLGTLILMLVVSPKVALVVFLLTPLSLLVSVFVAKGSFRHFGEQSKLQSSIASVASETFANQRLVYACGAGRIREEKLDKENQKLLKCGVKAQFFSALVNPSTRLINNIIYAIVGIICAASCIKGEISVGQISVFLTYATQYGKPFTEISAISAQLQSAVSSAKRIMEILKCPVDKETPDSKPKPDSAAMTFEDVCFSYTKDRKLIENFNLSVKPGQHIAIVGPTGCGKTTIINLIMRFYDVCSGSIKIGGTDIRDMDRNTLRSMFGMVLQDTWLFAGTVRENIAFANPDATDEEIINAAKLARAHSFIEKLPEGYDTFINSADDLSQGQMQLICIARIMLVNAPIMILDEATSNIDTRTEVFVQKAFEDASKGKTSFIVAHRLSTVKSADVILVMRDGNIVEQGTHDELISRSGFYSELYKAMRI